MVQWLVNNCDMFGLTGQNWMWLTAGGLGLYLAWLAFSRRHV